MSKKSGKVTVFSFLRRYNLLIAFSLALSLVSVALTLYVPILIGEAVDCIAGKGSVDFSLVKKLFICAAIVPVNALLQWLIGAVNNRVAFNTVSDIRKTLFERIQSLPLSFIDRKPIGDTVNRMISDVDVFANGMMLGFSQLFTGVITVIGTLLFMFSLNVKITVAVIVITPVSLFVARFIAKKSHKLFEEQSITRAKQTAVINETLSNQKLVKAFSYENKIIDRFDEINENLKDVSVKAFFFSSLVNPSTRFVNSLVYAAVGVFGALSVTGALGGGALTVGALTSFLSYANQYTKPFNEISGVITELQNAAVCIGRVLEIINLPPQEPDLCDALALKDVSGEVSFNNVYFSYDKNKRLIEDLNINAKSGDHIALVGPTGCGKTTLISLLMRFYEIDSGSITVDNNDIRKIKRNSLRKCYGMVLQETWLKQGTVRENIAFGRPDATDDEIIAAAKAAYAHSFIKRLPLGYDTVIGDESTGLSQGQKQLLCIARVMLLKPEILILDEATSSIDTRTEMKIQGAFETLMQGKTSFIVAHRLSTVRKADKIVVMRDGKVIETGTHNGLIKENGFYRKLYNSQFE